MERSRAALIATTPVRVSERAPEPGPGGPVPARRRAAARRAGESGSSPGNTGTGLAGIHCSTVE